MTYEERTWTVTTTDEEGNEVETEETNTVAIPIADQETVWSNIQTALGLIITEEQRGNADSIYNLVRYGAPSGTEGWIPGADVPFIGADGLSPAYTAPSLSRRSSRRSKTASSARRNDCVRSWSRIGPCRRTPRNMPERTAPLRSFPPPPLTRPASVLHHPLRAATGTRRS